MADTTAAPTPYTTARLIRELSRIMSSDPVYAAASVKYEVGTMSLLPTVEYVSVDEGAEIVVMLDEDKSTTTPTYATANLGELIWALSRMVRERPELADARVAFPVNTVYRESVFSVTADGNADEPIVILD